MVLTKIHLILKNVDRQLFLTYLDFEVIFQITELV